MKKVKRIILLGIFYLIIISAFSNVKATSAGITTNKTSMEVGSTATITVTVKAASWNLKLSGGLSENLVGYSDDGENTTEKETFSFKPTKVGTYTIKLSGDVTDGSTIKTKNVSDSVTITVKEVQKSSNASLSNLGITPHDFSTFKPGTTSYTVNVPYETSSIKIYANKGQSGQKITGTGNKKLDIGKNTFNVKVTAEDGKTTKTYTLTINRSSTSSVATLSNLGITPKEYDFTTFKSGTTSYNVNVPYEAEKIEIYAEATSSKATVTGTGEKTLQLGENKFDVVVTAEDGTKKTYTLVINRENEESEDEEQPTEAKGLAKLEIAGYTLNTEFDPNVYEYKIDIPEKIDKLDISTDVSSDDYDVEIAGNENLHQGENVITVLVHNKADDTTTTYQLIANIGEQDIDVSEINYLMDKAQSSLQKQLWIIKGTIVLIVLLIIVFLIQRYRINKHNEEDFSRFESDDDSEGKMIENNEEEPDDGYKDIKDQINEYEDIDESPKNRKHKKGKRFK